MGSPHPPTRCLGDLAYLDVTTLEGQVHYITATPTGFYLNRSTSPENFDPTPKKTHHLNRHLVGLLSQVSGINTTRKIFAKFSHCHYEVLALPSTDQPSLQEEFHSVAKIWVCVCMYTVQLAVCVVKHFVVEMRSPKMS